MHHRRVYWFNRALNHTVLQLVFQILPPALSWVHGSLQEIAKSVTALQIQGQLAFQQLLHHTDKRLLENHVFIGWWVIQTWFVVDGRTISASDNGTCDATVDLKRFLVINIVLTMSPSASSGRQINVLQQSHKVVTRYMPFISSKHSPCGTVGSGWLRSPPSGVRCRPAAACLGTVSPGKTSRLTVKV